MITSRKVDPKLVEFLCSVLHFPEKKKNRAFELADLYRIAADDDERREILSVLAEMLPQELCTMSTSEPLHIDDSVDEEAARKVHTYRKQVGRRIRDIRTAKVMTQAELSSLSGLPQSHISRLERGRHAATAETIRRIAGALDVEMGDIDPAF